MSKQTFRTIYVANGVKQSAVIALLLFSIYTSNVFK